MLFFSQLLKITDWANAYVLWIRDITKTNRPTNYLFLIVTSNISNLIGIFWFSCWSFNYIFEMNENMTRLSYLECLKWMFESGFDRRLLLLFGRLFSFCWITCLLSILLLPLYWNRHISCCDGNRNLFLIKEMKTLFLLQICGASRRSRSCWNSTEQRFHYFRWWNRNRWKIDEIRRFQDRERKWTRELGKPMKRAGPGSWRCTAIRESKKSDTCEQNDTEFSTVIRENRKVKALTVKTMTVQFSWWVSILSLWNNWKCLLNSNSGTEILQMRRSRTPRRETREMTNEGKRKIIVEKDTNPERQAGEVEEPVERVAHVKQSIE